MLKWLQALIDLTLKPLAIQGMIKNRQAPQLALELHKDGRGKLHISRAPVPEQTRYLDRMKTLERLLRQHTWFTERARFTD